VVIVKDQLEGTLVRVFIKETDRHKGKALADWIVDSAHRHGAKAAVAQTSSSGYVLDKTMATRKILDLWINMPVVIELIGEQAVMDKLVPILVEGVGQGIILTEKITMTVCTP
jgi:PII-like signaling protein